MCVFSFYTLFEDHNNSSRINAQLSLAALRLQILRIIASIIGINVIGQHSALISKQCAQLTHHISNVDFPALLSNGLSLIF